MSSARLSINPREGFLPHFTAGYLDRYGPKSEFARALADHFTRNFVGVMRSAGEFVDPESVARVSDDEAVKSLRQLIQVSENAWLAFYREALGTLPLGSTETTVDAVLGEGAFAEWLKAFQDRRHVDCAEIVRSRGAYVVA
ncbi:MAG TPA: hypothetical protein VNQ32_00775 [Steroidobacteraceae bacterium]|nr:hypothetical protein [Steroidobacteraceae bacterium]